MIAYLGPSGTFSELAAKKYCQLKNPKLSCQAYGTIYEVFRAVEREDARVGIVPIENSVEGSVTVTMDLLADKDFKLKIIQEIDIPIELQLIALKEHQQISNIISHPQPLAQCQHFLRENYPGVTVEAVASTAAAVQRIVENHELNTAAIASARAATDQMQIISSDIADYPDNVTRFVVLSKHPIKKVAKQKTSIVFSPGSKDKPGGLYDILGYFNKYQINLTKIESRPQKRVIGSYLFFIDFEGSSDEPEVKTLLKELGQVTSFFKDLGSYPVDI